MTVTIALIQEIWFLFSHSNGRSRRNRAFCVVKNRRRNWKRIDWVLDSMIWTVTGAPSQAPEIETIWVGVLSFFTIFLHFRRFIHNHITVASLYFFFFFYFLFFFFSRLSFSNLDACFGHVNDRFTMEQPDLLQSLPCSVWILPTTSSVRNDH